MTLFDQLPTNDEYLIANYIDDNAMVDGASRSVSISHILRFWSQNKEKLYKMFGEQFILSKEVTIQKSEDELTMEMENFISGDGYSFYTAFGNWARQSLKDQPIPNQYSRYRTINKDSEIMLLFSTAALVNNKYTGSNFEIETPEGKFIKVQNGCKPLKTIAKIAKAFNISGFEDFRLSHSRVLNQKSLKGDLCLSIHPLDYMTMSDNDSDWSSCMSWERNGCYRQGTVEMMNSEMVVVAYLAAKDNMHIRGGSWSNKKWRELFVVTPTLITNIKPYPYMNEELTNMTLSWLKELAEKAEFGKYTDNIYRYTNDYWLDVIELDNRKVRFVAETNNMYNDFENNGEGNQFAYISTTIPENYTHYFCYSGESECMACGEAEPELDSEQDLVGMCCAEVEYCNNCGDRIYEFSEVYEVDGETLCRYCYENSTAYDYIDKQDHLDGNMERFYISFNNGRTLIPTEILTHYRNFNKYDCGELFGAIYQVLVGYRKYNVVNVEDITESGKNFIVDAYGYRNFEDWLDELNSQGWGVMNITENTNVTYNTLYGEPVIMNN